MSDQEQAPLPATGEHPPPVVVGGTGGSGTRVIARILMHAGLYMGEHRNPQEDALEFAAFDLNWAPIFLASLANGTELADRERTAMNRQFARALDRHRAPMTDATAPWGWKQGTSSHLLPFLHDKYPGLHYIHVMRDGRDYAFGSGGGQGHANALVRALVHGDTSPVTRGKPAWVGSWREPAERVAATPVEKAQFWGRAHMDCADYAEAHLGSRYRRVRLEDLCTRPREAVETIFAFVGADADPEPMVDMIKVPDTIGSWRDQDPAEVEAVTTAAGPALTRFGYL